MLTLAALEKRSAGFWVVVGSLGVVAVGAIDLLSGREIALGPFYLMPIGVVTWFAGRNPGLAMCVASALTWFVADDFAGQAYSQPAIRYWNAVVRFMFFVVVTVLIPTLRALERERQLARHDALTGAPNRRSLTEVTQAELDRFQRYNHPFTIAYLDVDDFKAVNDRWGHRAGDQLLQAVVNRANRHLRKTDFLIRLGGDEFVILLPETDQQAAQATIAKVRAALGDEMQRNGWPVTFSIGALTCLNPEVPTDELIDRADDLMYSVKAAGKNAIAYATYNG